MSKRTSGAGNRSRSSVDHLSAQTIIGGFIIPSSPGCWLWTGWVDPAGYGRHPAAGHGPTPSGNGYVHRFVYETMHGPIPAGHVVHHVCEVKACCRPDHLELMTAADHTAHHTRTRHAIEDDRQRLLRAALWIGDRLHNNQAA